MDKEFQTTFIPKKPLAQNDTPMVKRSAGSPKSLSIFSALGYLMLGIAVIASAGVYVYNRALVSRIDGLRNSLNIAEEQFEPSLIIELQRLDERLRTADRLLANHVSVSPIFRIIENLTLPAMQYTQFDYVLEGNTAKVSMQGRAPSYQSIAEQSLLFGESRFVSNHIFSNFALDQNGRVTFSLNIDFTPDLFLFAQSLGKVPQNTLRSDSSILNQAVTQPIIPENQQSTEQSNLLNQSEIEQDAVSFTSQDPSISTVSSPVAPSPTNL